MLDNGDRDAIDLFTDRTSKIVARSHHLLSLATASLEASTAEFASLREACLLMVRGADKRFVLMSADDKRAVILAMEQAFDFVPESLSLEQVNLLYCLGTPEALAFAEQAEGRGGSR